MRVGISPTRNEPTDYQPARVTVCVLTFIPNQLGYFRYRFGVLKLCLDSLFKHTDGPYDLLVFDNGSCPEVVAYLQSLREQDLIQYLIFSSRNLGTMGAFDTLFWAAPGEIIAYCDDDILFYPGWLPAHLQILDTFPNIGMVSGWAIRQRFGYGIQSCLDWADANPDVRLERARRIPEEWEIDFAVSTGRDPKVYLAETEDMEDIILHYGDVSAYATANHFQFIAPKAALIDAFPHEWDPVLMPSLAHLDEAVDAKGYLRLSTIERYVRHIGNTISPEIHQQALAFGLEVGAPTPPRGTPLWARLLRKSGLRQVLNRIYNYLYWRN